MSTARGLLQVPAVTSSDFAYFLQHLTCHVTAIEKVVSVGPPSEPRQEWNESGLRKVKDVV